MISFFTRPITSLWTSSEAFATSRFVLSSVTVCLHCGHFATVTSGSGLMVLPYRSTSVITNVRREIRYHAEGSSACASFFFWFRLTTTYVTVSHALRMPV